MSDAPPSLGPSKPIPGDPNQIKHKTCRRYNTPGDAHALTFTCYHRQPFLSRDRTRLWLVDSLAKARIKHEFELWAYVFMPEHVHLLIYPKRESYSVSSFLLDIKRPVARLALRYVRENAPTFLSRMKDAQPSGVVHHRFWQRGGGYDRNLTQSKTIHNTIAYIHANPVRRELVTLPEDWYWSSAGFYLDRRDVALKPDLDSLPPLDRDVV